MYLDVLSLLALSPPTLLFSVIIFPGKTSASRSEQMEVTQGAPSFEQVPFCPFLISTETENKITAQRRRRR
jgi:hypothetical protein